MANKKQHKKKRRKKKLDEKQKAEQKILVSDCWNDYIDEYVLEIPILDPTQQDNAALPLEGSSDELVSE
jgi:hypothetical protein